MISFYERDSEVRQAYDEVVGLSVIDVDVLLRKRQALKGFEGSVKVLVHGSW
jgi:hypothetical protein